MNAPRKTSDVIILGITGNLKLEALSLRRANGPPPLIVDSETYHGPESDPYVYRGEGGGGGGFQKPKDF